MQYIAYPSGIKGRLRAPASKSVAQRAIAVASMAGGRSVIDFPGNCDDVLAAINVCRTLGARIAEHEQHLVIDGGISLPAQPLNCGESGLGIRMFSGVAATFDEEVILTGSGSLMSRPMNMIETTLTAAGASCKSSGGRLPLFIKGPVRGGTATIDGSQSSQALTGLLIASPKAEKDLTIVVNDLKSKEYIDITIRVMNSFGVEVTNNDYQAFFIRAGQTYQPSHFTVEGDWSGAAFLLVAGAIAGSIAVDNLDLHSTQPDRKILDALRDAGAIIEHDKESIQITNRQALQGFVFDATHCPDLFPPLAALAANCTGDSRIFGVSRLKNKESDRAATLMDTFGKLGVDISLDGDAMVITGGRIQGANIYSHSDHRIAMAGAVAALNARSKVIIDHAEAINKSYPAFFTDLESCQVPKK
jgi:3-phosphoshikimate 1-carboxyvinyltransferase